MRVDQNQINSIQLISQEKQVKSRNVNVIPASKTQTDSMYRKSAKKVSNKGTISDSKPSVAVTRPTTSKQSYMHQPSYSVQQNKAVVSQSKKPSVSG